MLFRSDTLLNIANLAWTWKHLGRNPDAWDLMQKTVDLSRKTLGSQHPDTVKRAKNLEKCLVKNVNFDYTLGSFARWHYLPTTILVLILACLLLPILSSFRM